MTTKLNNAVTVELLPVAAATDTAEGTTVTGIDISKYIGPVMFTLHSALGTGNADNTLNGKIQSSTTVGGSYADVTGATFTEVDDTAGGAIESITVDANSMGGFVKFVGTIAGTTPSFICGVTITGIKQIH